MLLVHSHTSFYINQQCKFKNGFKFKSALVKKVDIMQPLLSAVFNKILANSFVTPQKQLANVFGKSFLSRFDDNYFLRK